MDERLKRQLDFILELDKEKNVFRQTHLSGHGRRENDADNTYRHCGRQSPNKKRTAGFATVCACKQTPCFLNIFHTFLG